MAAPRLPLDSSHMLLTSKRFMQALCLPSNWYMDGTCSIPSSPASCFVQSISRAWQTVLDSATFAVTFALCSLAMAAESCSLRLSACRLPNRCSWNAASAAVSAAMWACEGNKAWAG
jgi:hypothetical protein